MNLLCISTGQYPDQHAAAIRHSTIAQGLVENGNTVNFWVLSPQNWDGQKINYKGIAFETLINYRGTNKMLKHLHFLLALLLLRKKIKAIHETTTLDAIVVYSINTLLLYFSLQISKKLRIKIFHERTELPYIVGQSTSFLGKKNYSYYLKILIPKFDGLFVISDKLKTFFKPYNKNIKKVLTVVDTDFFKPKTKAVYNFPYIAYCGKMSGTKDGVPIMIRAFAQLLTHFPEYKLLLIGDNSDDKAIAKTLHTINKLKLENHVIFTGMVDRDIMPNLLGNARLLAVSKPNNEQNTGNFPIKAGEYLATGNPVVLTKVGEIPKYITDGEQAFLAEPDSVVSFYKKMDEALNDYEKACKIGLNGRELAKKLFDYKIQAKAMTDFINNACPKSPISALRPS